MTVGLTEKEATARIKINKLLEGVGWRFFQEGGLPANIRLELSVTIKQTDLDAFGVNFEKTKPGTRDFKAVPKKYRELIPDYVKDYVSLNQFSS